MTAADFLLDHTDDTIDDENNEPFYFGEGVEFTGGPSDLPWGTSRRWRSWVEFHAGNLLLASSADNDFAVMSGKVTEDIGRSIRRDAQLQLLFAQNPLRRTVPVFAFATSGGPFTVSTSAVGDTDEIGGAGSSTEESSIPAVISDTARSPWIPTAIGDLLDPHSLATMRIYAGYEGEEVLLGFFDLAETMVKAEAGGSIIDITAHSLERRLDRAGFWQMEAFADNTQVVDAVVALVHEVFPVTLVSGYAIYGPVIGELTWGPADNRLSKITEMLAIGGLEAGFDRTNTFAIARAPTSVDFGIQPPQWHIVDGFNGIVSTLNSAARRFSDADSYNGVIVEGSSSTDPQAAPLFSARWNLNPSSPLHFDPDNPGASPMGPRPKHIRSELVTTQSGADSMAAMELAKVLMVTDSVDVTVPANPELEMGQFTRLTCDALGVDAVYRITRVSHDLAGGQAELTLYRFTGV